MGPDEESRQKGTVVATALDATGEVYDGVTDALGAGVTLAVTLSAAKALAEVATRFPDTELVGGVLPGRGVGACGKQAFRRRTAFLPMCESR